MFIGKLFWDVSSTQDGRRNKDTDDSTWLQSYEALLVYIRENGTGNVPHDLRFTCVLPDGSAYDGQLGSWVAWQRALRTRLGAAARGLSDERQELLQILVDKGNYIFKHSYYNTPLIFRISHTSSIALLCR